MTRDQIITGLVAAKEAEDARPCKDCWCMGPYPDDDRACRCKMDILERQADAILAASGEPIPPPIDHPKVMHGDFMQTTGANRK